MGFRTYLLRLRPTHAQVRMLNRIIDLCCDAYNRLLGEQLSFLLEHGHLMSVYELNALLPPLKKLHPEYREVNARTLQNLSKRVYESSERWLDLMDKTEFTMPRHKRRSRMRSFCFTAPEDFIVMRNRIHLSKMEKDDSIRFKCNQHIRGEMRTCTVVRVKKTWLCRVGCNVPERTDLPDPDDRPVVGADLGLATLVTLSDGTIFKRFDPEKDVVRQLKKAQRHLSDCEYGTPEFEKWHNRIINKHARIANRRENNTRHVARYIAEHYSKVGIEDIGLPDLIHDEVLPGLRRSQYNARWGNLVKDLCQAAKSTGTEVISVDPFCTSQLCCRCDAYVRKDLSVRVHKCWWCGLEIDRDLNAALNVLKSAVGCTATDIARELQASKPRTIVFNQHNHRTQPNYFFLSYFVFLTLRTDHAVMKSLYSFSQVFFHPRVSGSRGESEAMINPSDLLTICSAFVKDLRLAFIRGQGMNPYRCCSSSQWIIVGGLHTGPFLGVLSNLVFAFDRVRCNAVPINRFNKLFSVAERRPLFIFSGFPDHSQAFFYHFR